MGCIGQRTEAVAVQPLDLAAHVRQHALHLLGLGLRLGPGPGLGLGLRLALELGLALEFG